MNRPSARKDTSYKVKNTFLEFTAGEDEAAVYKRRTRSDQVDLRHSPLVVASKSPSASPLLHPVDETRQALPIDEVQFEMLEEACNEDGEISLTSSSKRPAEPGEAVAQVAAGMGRDEPAYVVPTTPSPFLHSSFAPPVPPFGAFGYGSSDVGLPPAFDGEVSLPMAYGSQELMDGTSYLQGIPFMPEMFNMSGFMPYPWNASPEELQQFQELMACQQLASLEMNQEEQLQTEELPQPEIQEEAAGETADVNVSEAAAKDATLTTSAVPETTASSSADAWRKDSKSGKGKGKQREDEWYKSKNKEWWEEEQGTGYESKRDDWGRSKDSKDEYWGKPKDQKDDYWGKSKDQRDDYWGKSKDDYWGKGKGKESKEDDWASKPSRAWDDKSKVSSTGGQGGNGSYADGGVDKHNGVGPPARPEGDEPYTTVMLRNIPNKYTREMLIKQLNADFSGEYDFMYLPIDFKNRCNVGYGFINFRVEASTDRFISMFHGVDVRKCLPGLNSKKIVEVTPARVQGLTENVRRLKNSPVMNQLVDHPEWMPLLFGANGEEEPFPMPDAPLPPVKPRGRAREGGASSGGAIGQ